MQQEGGDVEHRLVDDLADLSGNVAAIINCAGLGTRKPANDNPPYPIRNSLRGCPSSQVLLGPTRMRGWS
jgi:hypothetical protein